MIFVYYYWPDEDNVFGLEEFVTRDLAEKFMNENAQYKCQVIDGYELKVEAVTTVTRMRIGNRK